MLVVNFATREYRRAQQRLKISLKNHHGLFFEDYPFGWPTHQQSPYAFKIHAIKEAMKIDPIVLWADASFYLVGDLSVIENIIINDGFFGSEAGHYAGRWTNQHTRDYFKVTEEEMQQGPGGITLFSAGLLGLNKNSEIAMEFLRQWEAASVAGCFSGSWENHRHDQTSASIIATRLGLKYQRGGQHMSYIGPGYSQPEKESVFHLQGM